MSELQASRTAQQQQSQHSALISLLVNKTVRLQKEIGNRNRKFKDIYESLEAAVEALTSFQNVTWPPTDQQQQQQQQQQQPLMTIANMDDNLSNGNHVEPADVSFLSDDTPEQSPARIQRQNSLTTPVRVLPHHVQAMDEHLAEHLLEATASQPMHPAVSKAITSYCYIIDHPKRTPKMVEVTLECTFLLIANRYVSGQAVGGKEPSMDASTAGTDSKSLSDIDLLIQSLCASADSISDIVQTFTIKCLLALTTSSICSVHEGALLKALRTIFQIHLASKHFTTRDVSKAALFDMARTVLMRLETYDSISRSEKEHLSSSLDSSQLNHEDSTTDEELTSSTSAASVFKDISKGINVDIDAILPKDDFSTFASKFHIDTYLVFRSLCKMSAKALPGDNATLDGNKFLGNTSSKLISAFSPVGSNMEDPLAYRSKILSLELILSMLESSGHAFCTGERFIFAIQNYLCVSLLKNCVSNYMPVAQLGLKIFLILVFKLKQYLKEEIEVFISKIFLIVLESPNSPFEQRRWVLESLRVLCSEPLILTQIFLEYDCDFDAPDLYKNILDHLTSLVVRILSNTHNKAVSATEKTSLHDSILIVAGLDVLVSILQAFLKFLDLPGADEDLIDDNAARNDKVRGLLQVHLPQAAKSLHAKMSSLDDLGQESKIASSNLSESDLSQYNNSNSAIESYTAGPTVPGSIIDTFDKKREGKRNFETGMIKFALSAKQGVMFFIETGFLKLDAKEIALFLYRNKDKLNKTQIGELLGREPDASFVKDKSEDPEKGGEGFFVRLLHHYVSDMNFVGLEFDDAIRLFLSGFRLPGEAQKIDRIMEKFAECFTSQNEGVFQSADTAFILAFSVIMLQTDLHNPNIKPEKRMTVDMFIRNNKGISVDGGDLPDELLEGIYKRIQAQPFTLKEDDEAREALAKTAKVESGIGIDVSIVFGSNAEDKKRERFARERETMLLKSEQQFRKRQVSKAITSKVSNPPPDYVSPSDAAKLMFNVTWSPLLGALSQILEMSQDETSIKLCLSAISYSVRISAHCDISVARETFVNSLSKFTTLGSIKQMQKKHVECIQTLLDIAADDGEYLGESWTPVLQCISQLGRLRLSASGLASDQTFLGDHDASKDALNKRQATKIESDREIEENNGRILLTAIQEVALDRVFSSTIHLSTKGIVFFIDCLVAVSDAEISSDNRKAISGVGRTNASTASRSLAGDDGPRIFSLQKLVEVADYNMNVRPRLAWAQMWDRMSEYFVKIGSHENSLVSMFAIDALRQLSFKFLEKPELKDFNFQRLFLRPFLLIMENPSCRENNRELVLRCVDNMIRSVSRNLRSGWKVIFSILSLTANDSSEKICTLGITILQYLLDNHLDKLVCVDDPNQSPDSGVLSASEKRERNAHAEDFVSLCRASLSFVSLEKSKRTLAIDLSMRALAHAACYADLLAAGKILPPVSCAQVEDPSAFGYTYKDLSSSEAEEMVLWRPIFDGLLRGIQYNSSGTSQGVGCLLQRGSLMTLRSILLSHGQRFSIQQWKCILESITAGLQASARLDSSPVSIIVSESPSVTKIDFLSAPLPSLPSFEDKGLQEFAISLQRGSSSRPLGYAELLAEASFVDLKYGGDGDLSHVHELRRKSLATSNSSKAHPFPDSWIATTGPMALGMLTDIFKSFLFHLGDSRIKDELWPIAKNLLVIWTEGIPAEDEKDTWEPCEALVRTCCQEISRLSHIFADMTDPNGWVDSFFITLAELLHNVVDSERYLRSFFLVSLADSLNNIVETDNIKAHRAATDDSLLRKYIAPLKARCISCYCLQEAILSIIDSLGSSTGLDSASALLGCLEESREVAFEASIDQVLTKAFYDGPPFDPTLLSTSGSITNTNGRSEMFFLTQEASATNCSVRFLTIMYCSPSGSDALQSWDAPEYAESLLLERIIQVLDKFLESEKMYGKLLDPKVWQSSSDSGRNIAVYCTSFARVVVTILNSLRSFSVDQFDRHKKDLYPIICSLIRVQSDEIRELVTNLMTEKSSAFIGT